MNADEVFGVVGSLSLKYDFINVEDLSHVCLFLNDHHVGKMKQWEVDASYGRVRGASQKLMKLLTTDQALSLEGQRLRALFPGFFVALGELERADPIKVDRVDKQYVGYVLCEMYRETRGRSGIGGDGSPELIQCVSDVLASFGLHVPDVKDQADYASMLRKWSRNVRGVKIKEK